VLIAHQPVLVELAKDDPRRRGSSLASSTSTG